jgi:integrase
MLYCRTENGWRRFPAAFGKNGRIRPNYAEVAGEQVHFDTARYEIRFYAGRKVQFKAVQGSAKDALAARRRQEALLVARDSAKASGATLVENEPTRKKLTQEKQRWLEGLEARGKAEFIKTARVAIDDFLAATELIYADQITADAMLVFYRVLRKRGNSARTLYNKVINLSAWFKDMGLEVKSIVKHKPVYTEREVDVYSPEEIGDLFRACRNDYQRALFDVLLKAGLREQEAVNLEWTNVDFRAKVLRVRENVQTGSSIKDRAERSVPMPDSLIESLRAWREKRPKAHLVLGTATDRPNNKMLRTLKRVVSAAKLNCGRCDGCTTRDECRRWRLHKFRATYTTRLLQNGVDARTVMAYTGHADLATVLRYLAPAEDAPMQSRISSIEWVR